MDKYKQVKLAGDYRERLRALPMQAWWAEDDEPMYQIPPNFGGWYPHRVAVQNGLVVEVDEVTADG
jgi:hypothetical protein